jgi:hypothetical protein
VNLENALWIAGIAAEVSVVSLLLYRRVWKSFPIFSIYLLWGLLTDTGNILILRHWRSHYLSAYLIETAVDSALEFGILVELTWSVLRPIRRSLSPKFVLIVACAILVAGASIWPFTGIVLHPHIGMQLEVLFRVKQTASFLRILLFLLIAACSQMLSIGWRDRELQIATGLGIYSIVSIAVDALQRHFALRGAQFTELNLLVAIAYLGSLLYWAVSFAAQEAKRREFTPQIQNVLLTMAGAAHATRIALQDSTGAVKKMDS